MSSVQPTAGGVQEADLALGNFRVTAGRAAVADYTHPYVFYDAVLAYKTPGTSISHSVDFYLNPLEPEVYAALLGCLLWVLLLLTWSRAWHRYTQGQQTAALELTECLVADAEIVVAAMLNKREDLVPKASLSKGREDLVPKASLSKGRNMREEEERDRRETEHSMKLGRGGA